MDTATINKARVDRATMDKDTRTPGYASVGWTCSACGELISAMLATLTRHDVVAPLADLSGIDPLAVPQPRVMHMVTGGAVTEVLDTTGLNPIPDAGYSGDAHLLGDPTLDLADDDDRGEQVRRWLIQIALDGGLTGMEKVLEPHAASHPQTPLA